MQQHNEEVDSYERAPKIRYHLPSQPPFKHARKHNPFDCGGEHNLTRTRSEVPHVSCRMLSYAQAVHTELSTKSTTQLSTNRTSRAYLAIPRHNLPPRCVPHGKKKKYRHESTFPGFAPRKLHPNQASVSRRFNLCVDGDRFDLRLRTPHSIQGRRMQSRLRTLPHHAPLPPIQRANNPLPDLLIHKTLPTFH